MQPNMNLREILVAVRALIAEEEHWCKQAHAQDVNKHVVGVDDPEAYSFCLTGAVRRALLDAGIDDAMESGWVFRALVKCLDGDQLSRSMAAINGFVLTGFNDTATHAEVLALLDKAIASCSQRENACNPQ